MVESVSGINSTTQIAAAASATEKVDTKAKQEETQKAKQEEKTDKDRNCSRHKDSTGCGSFCIVSLL